MKRKHLIIIFILLFASMILMNPLVITVEDLPDFKMIDEYNQSKVFSEHQKNQIEAFIEGKIFIKHMNIYADYKLNKEGFKSISLDIKNIRDNPLLIKNNLIFNDESYYTTRIIISKTGLIGSSRIRIDGHYYKLSKADEKKLLEIFE